MSHPRDFAGRPGGALVVGGSGGLGSAVALMLAARGSDVAVTFPRNERAAGEVLAAMDAERVRTASWQVDLTEMEAQLRSDAAGFFNVVHPALP